MTKTTLGLNYYIDGHRVQAQTDLPRQSLTDPEWIARINLEIGICPTCPSAPWSPPLKEPAGRFSHDVSGESPTILCQSSGVSCKSCSSTLSIS
jgi:hypothetical protein